MQVTRESRDSPVNPRPVLEAGPGLEAPRLPVRQLEVTSPRDWTPFFAAAGVLAARGRRPGQARGPGRGSFKSQSVTSEAVSALLPLSYSTTGGWAPWMSPVQASAESVISSSPLLTGRLRAAGAVGADGAAKPVPSRCTGGSFA